MPRRLKTKENAMSRFNLPAVLGLLLVVSALPVVAAEGEDPPTPVTIDDPAIPVDQLELLLKPLPKAQLLVEANAWQGLVQETSEAIAAAQIEAKRLQGDAPELEDADEAGVDAAVDSVRAALLNDINELREERTHRLDGLTAAVAALEAKASPDDADTQAQIRDYRLYASAVRGIELDLADAGASWLAIQGWLTSDEGGLRWVLNIAKFIGILLVAWIVSGIFRSMIHRGLQKVPGTSALLEDFLVRAA
ncbi:MAG: hypothetical protein PVJ30_02145, partial [Thiohalocapsa sp.]